MVNSIDVKKFTSGVSSIIILCVFLYPPVIWAYTQLNLAIRIVQIFLGIMIFLVYVMDKIKEFKCGEFKSKFIIMLIIYYIYLFIVTYINDGRIVNLCSQAMQFVIFCMYLELVIKYNLNTIYSKCFWILYLNVSINLLTLIFLKNGVYSTVYFDNNYFLGYDNQHINYFLPLMILNIMRYKSYKKDKILTIIVISIVILSTFIIKSGMTTIMVLGLSIFSLLIIYDNNKFSKFLINNRFFNYFYLLSFDILLNIGIVTFNIQKYFSFIIEKILNKSVTLSNRIYIWESTINLIRTKPIFGRGMQEYSQRALMMGFGENSPAGLHSHNRFLEVLYSGGLVLFSFFVYILIYIGSFLEEFKDSIQTKIIVLGLIIYLFGMITEFYSYSIFFWGLMLMAEKIEYLVPKEK